MRFDHTLRAGSVIEPSATVSGDSGEINNWWPGTTVEAGPASSPPPTVVAPSVPRALHARPGPRRARLSWVAPAKTGGAPVNRYQLRRGDWFRTVSADARTYMFTGLRKGRQYTLSVRAHNTAGFGPWARAVRVRARPAARPRGIYRTASAGPRRGTAPQGAR